MIILQMQLSFIQISQRNHFREDPKITFIIGTIILLNIFDILILNTNKTSIMNTPDS